MKRFLTLSITLVLIMFIGTVCAESYGAWDLMNYHDEFGDPIGKMYVRPSNLIAGTFSNSATINSSAFLDINISYDRMVFNLYEYRASSNAIVKRYQATNYTIKLKNASSTFETTGTMAANTPYLYIDNFVSMVSFMTSSSKCSIYLEESAVYGTRSTYLFKDINTNGLYECILALIHSEEDPVEKKNGLTLDDDGVYRYYEDGNFIAKSGIIDFQGGKFFLANGLICTDVNGLAEYGGQWYFLAGGQIQTQYTGLALYDGHWFFVTNGLFNPMLNGLVDYDGSKFIVAAGEVIRGVNGLWQNTDGVWYYLADSQVVTYYTGLVQYDGAWFYVINGRLATEYSGPVDYAGTTFQVVGGQVVQ